MKYCSHSVPTLIIAVIVTACTVFFVFELCLVFVCYFLCSGSVEVDLSVDRFTKKIKGFAHIKFSPPENAVKALADLDGSVFQVFCFFYS